MIDFLLALFGGIFYYGAISSEKALTYDREKKWEEKMDFHKSISCTMDEDAELIQRLIRSSYEEQIKVLESISDELTEVYGENWREQYPHGTSQYWAMEVREPWGIALHILASKESKLPQIGSMSYDLGRGLGVEGRSRVIKACEIIERNMQKKYPELKIWFVPGTKPSNKNYAEFYEELGLGYLKWEHLMSPPTKRCNPPIRRLW